MSDLESANWSETAASNTAATPNGWPEGQPASTVNDCAREMMGAGKREWNRSHPTITSGGTNTVTLTYATAPAAYVQGQTYSFIAGGNNSGATTLNVNGLGAKAVTKNGATALAGGEILSGAVVTVMYDGTQFQLTDGVFSATLPTLTSHALQVGAGTTTATQLAPGTAGTVPTSNGASADPSYQAIPSSGFRNWLLNGAMGVWQRGAGGSASIALAASSTAYTADRWYLSTLTNQASTVAQTAITTLAGTRYAARVQRNSGQTGTGVMVFAQPLDADIISAIVGQTCVLSAQVSTGANWSPASGTLSYKVYCGVGSVGKRNASAYSTETAPISGSTNIAAGTAVTPITIATGAIPAGTTQMEVQFFWTPVGTAGANDWFQISNIQLEVGSTATAFDASRQNFVTELEQCQRFYQKTFPYVTAPAQNSGTLVGCHVTQDSAATPPNETRDYKLMTRMRVATSVTTYNPSVGNANWRDVTNSADRVASVSQAGDVNIVLAAASPGANGVAYIHTACDSEI